ncbi:TPA: ABC transporter substrate-binding protein [Legionella pneumophila]|uniref:ABC transporter substrate-binding protein n=1 Tax=Legionella pneumophila TaxID=446 RepID=A0AAN5KT61_LEGPN|nr:ABC transporter substrate-binding protein [Legionella pneumophila]HAT1973499.1 ABC transporter substrate-binding protein [Legionella pneumophila]HAT6958004.1 ABC transporter substrate-binding protein [Legionella pneumophila]HEN4771600.1 ABC transporter substrate-binding protein [Legionella pneumophila]
MTNFFTRSAPLSFVLVIALIFINLSYAYEFQTDSKNKNKLDVHIGIYAPFSSHSAFIGRNILAAMEMGSEQLQPSNIHYSFYTLDQAPENRSAALVLQKFINTHHINVLVTGGKETGLIAAPIAKKNNLIHFSLTNNPKIADGINNFIVWSPVYDQAKVLVNELKRQQVHHLGIITANQASSTVLTHSVIKELRVDSHIDVAASEFFEPGNKDFSRVTNRMKRKNADMYLVMASPEDIKLIQEQMVVDKLHVPITSIVERATPEVLKVFEGQWYVDSHEMQPDFINQFKQDYLNYPVTEAGYAFDLFKLLNKSIVMAIRTQGSVSNEEVVHQLHDIANGRGVMGTMVLDDKGSLFTKSEVKAVKKGEIHTV